MSERKNIDRLFQEKFKDFEANPAEEVWGNIETRLEEKKRRRVIPFWWKLSGVAALLVVGFLITQSALDNDIAPFNSDTTPNNPIVTESNPNPSKDKTDGHKGIVNPNKESNTDLNSGSENPVVNSNEAIVNSSTGKDNKNSAAKENNKTSLGSSSKSSIADGKSIKKRSLKNKLHSKEHNTSISETALDQSENQLATNQKKEANSANENAIAGTLDKNNPDNISPKSNDKDINLDVLKGGINSKIATTDKDEKVNDTTQKTGVAQNALEELLKEKEGKLKQESKPNRWQLTSNVAPIFLGSMSGGSPIDSTLVNNSKTYNTGVGFGLGVSYAVNKKLTVRTGLNKFNMSYNTNDIVYYADMESRGLRNVNTTVASSMIHIENGHTPSNLTTIASETGFLPFEDSFAHKNKGYINQEIGYLEMPVELTYAVVDKRFGLKLIGGFSTLFLQDNEVSLVSSDRSTFLGEANNLNDVHFSTNIGLGIKYGFMKSFEINVEPTFKYQLNTFSGDAGNFKPYLFGIYSGISYKF